MIDCIAAMACADGKLPKARITKLEKAKKTPAIKPQPIAERRSKIFTCALYPFGLRRA